MKIQIQSHERPTNSCISFLRNSQDAFKDAIENGGLSMDPSHPNYYRRYTYQYSTYVVDSFKHKITNEYLILPK